MFNPYEIMETIHMLEEEKLDIRTITMGISLQDCAHGDISILKKKIYDKICNYAKDLVKVADEIQLKYDIPIINKRIAVTPIAMIGGTGTEEDYISIARTLDEAAKEVGVDFIGGFSALVHKGYTDNDRKLIASIPEALASTERVCSSVNVATTKAGINMDAVAEMGRVIKKTAELTADKDGIGCSKLVVFANVPEDNPFMAGAFHGPGEGECVINVGISGPGTVKAALQKVKGKPFDEVAETVKKTAFKITRMGQLVAREAARMLGVPFGIVDIGLTRYPSLTSRTGITRGGRIIRVRNSRVRASRSRGSSPGDIALP